MISKVKKNVKVKKSPRLTVAQMVAKRNAAFAAMTPEQKQVAIAKDVLKQLRSKRKNKIIPAHVYFAGYLKEELLKDVKDFSEVLDKVEDCTCCGIGALFLSKVRLFDAVPIEKVNDGPSVEIAGAQCVGMSRFGITQALDGFFSRDQLLLIESAFELYGRYSSLQYTKACEFGDQFPDLPSRMAGIMKNIVANNGTFVP